ncbi:MAG: NAD(P)/FAD-dependent oxidoreductase [Lachnospiraceae bacterium]|nr:NAD(P)/FAD-dependent oxidoreductase [Lachnospiraceae bacterium]
MSESKKKIVIVGGGIAGLAAGIYGRLEGYEVDIYEKNPIAGGQCMGWNRKGCHIDNCIHWLTGTKKGTSLRKVWETVGALEENTKFADCDSFYTSITGNARVTLWKDLERTEAELLKLSPEDETEIKKFIEHVKYAAECEMPAEKPMDAMGIGDYIRMGASMANMPKVTKEYGSIDLQEMAARFKHPALKALFTDYMPKEYVASSYLVSYATMVSGNGEIPLGGSLAMTNRMVERFRQLGGKLHCNVSVSRILIKNKKAVGIETADKKTILADYVISAVDTMEMFEKLIGKEYMDSKWQSCYADTEKYPLFSAVQAAFVIDQEVYDEKGTIFFDCAPFETGGKKVDRISVKSYEYEPDFAPAGKVVLQVNVPQFDKEYFYWKGLSKEEYEKQKKEAIKAIEECLLTQFPKLKGHMEFLDCWTPRTYERYCNAYHGAYMGFITKKGVKSFRVKGVVKGIKNLYIASQWIMAPGGLPVAVTAGKFAIWRITRKEK